MEAQRRPVSRTEHVSSHVRDVEDTQTRTMEVQTFQNGDNGGVGLAMVGVAAIAAAGAAVVRQLWVRRNRAQDLGKSQSGQGGQIRHWRREQPLALEYGSAEGDQVPRRTARHLFSQAPTQPQVHGMKGRCMPGWNAAVRVSGHYNFQWLRAEAPPPEDSDECDSHFFEEIPGATHSKYTSQFEDVGKFLAVRCVPLEGLHPKTITLTACEPVLLDRELVKASFMYDKIVIKVKLLNANEKFRDLILYLNQKHFTLGKAKHSPLIHEKYKSCPQSVFLLPNEKRALFTIDRPSGMVPLELEFGSRKERDASVYLFRKLNLGAAERLRRKGRVAHPYSPPHAAPAVPDAAPYRHANASDPPAKPHASHEPLSDGTLHIKVDATGRR